MHSFARPDVSLPAHAGTHLDLGERRLQLAFGSAADHHIGALGRGELGDRQPEALRPACDQDILQ